ncbi:unnamed protein product, partial [Staurois parvus]
MPLVLFHRLFRVWARTQGPHDPLLPGGPMSCQSAPGHNVKESPTFLIVIKTEKEENLPMGTLVLVTTRDSFTFLSIPVLALGQETKGNLPNGT